MLVPVSSTAPWVVLHWKLSPQSFSGGVLAGQFCVSPCFLP